MRAREDGVRRQSARKTTRWRFGLVKIPLAGASGWWKLTRWRIAAFRFEKAAAGGSPGAPAP